MSVILYLCPRSFITPSNTHSFFSFPIFSMTTSLEQPIAKISSAIL